MDHNYNYPQSKPSPVGGPTMAQQQFEPAVNVNNIYRKFQETGFLTDPGTRASTQALFGDFSNVPDFLDIQNKIVEAQRSFEMLPQIVRERFHSDPQEMLAFLADKNNRPEAEKLGLIAPPKKEEPPLGDIEKTIEQLKENEIFQNEEVVIKKRAKVSQRDIEAAQRETLSKSKKDLE
jgi:phage internal scaffolding protein